MAIRTSIELTDNFSSAFAGIISAVDNGIYSVDRLNNALGANINPVGIQAATSAAHEFDAALQSIEAPNIDSVNVDPITVPVIWQTDDLEVFQNTGVERFNSEVQNANDKIEK